MVKLPEEYINDAQFKSELSPIKSLIDNSLERFFDSERNFFEKRGPAAVESLETTREFCLRDGKRIRPILVVAGYMIPKREAKYDVIDASIYAELFHSFLLIHDDIIDRDETRRDKPTVHSMYREKTRNLDSLIAAEESEIMHVGNSLAILDGDMLSYLANKVLLRSRFPDNCKVSALLELSMTAINTSIGQKMDVLSTLKNVDLEFVYKINKLKTAEYTVSRPLKVGAILGGATREVLQELYNYGINAGLAFQLKDDELGILNPELLKKSKNDISEGKKTLLILNAINNASSPGRKIILNGLGKKNLSQKELKGIVEVIKSTGAVDLNRESYLNNYKYAKMQAEERLAPLEERLYGSSSISKFLGAFAEYLVKRER